MPRGMQGARSKVVTSSDSTERKSAGAPQWVHPLSGDAVAALLARLPATDLVAVIPVNA